QYLNSSKKILNIVNNFSIKCCHYEVFTYWIYSCSSPSDTGPDELRFPETLLQRLSTGHGCGVVL
ncbi:MAG: hypothetical protein KDG51_01910, partial [Calditrichaeota bacterium]|nr:hypothetical protein [Calditrichota bacterium]